MRFWKPAALAAALAGAAGVGAAVAPAAAQAQAVRVAPGNVEVINLGSGRIGVTVSDLEATDAKSASGVRIESVTEGSAAEKAGLRQGDIVVEFDGERVRSVRQFTRLVSETPVGRTVAAVVMRDGQRVTVNVAPRENERFGLYSGDGWRVLEELQARRPAPAPVPPSFETLFRRSNSFGITVNTLTDQLGEYFGTKTGVLVTNVQTDSLASKIGVKAGDVITAINGATVEDSAELRRRMDRLEAGEEFTLSVMRDKKSMTLTGKIEPTRSRRGARRCCSTASSTSPSKSTSTACPTATRC